MKKETKYTCYKAEGFDKFYHINKFYTAKQIAKYEKKWYEAMSESDRIEYDRINSLTQMEWFKEITT
jgi:hypothetical protein